MEVAFIGLGIMGSRMASNLIKNNVSVSVYNRSEAAVEALVQKGAKGANSAVEAVASADLVFSMLADPKAVKAVFLGENGALKAMKTNALWVDCSTVNPSFSLHLHKEAKTKGIRFLDAPVAGTKPQAENASMAFFVGGQEEYLVEAKPYLEMMGQKVIHIGEEGKGSSFKMIVNIMLAQSMVVFSEALLLGEQMGISKDFLLNVVPNLPVAAPFTKMKADMIKEDNYEVQFPLELMYKDLHLASITAYEHQQPLHLANHAKELYAAASKSGLGRLDFAVIHQFLEGK